MAVAGDVHGLGERDDLVLVVLLSLADLTRRPDAGVGELEGLSRDFVRLLEEARGVSV